MGWLSMSRYHMDGHATPKAYPEAQFTYHRDLEDEQSRGLKVLDTACVQNRVWYAAAQVIKNVVPGEVVAIVCLVRWNPRSPTNEHFAYKDMDESMGPYEAECPERILDLLTPTDRENSIEWRARCRANLAKRKREIRDGMRIRLAKPSTFTDGFEGDEFVVCKRKSHITFKLVGRHGIYRISDFRSREWTVVPETKVHKTLFSRAVNKS